MFYRLNNLMKKTIGLLLLFVFSSSVVFAYESGDLNDVLNAIKENDIIVLERLLDSEAFVHDINHMYNFPVLPSIEASKLLLEHKKSGMNGIDFIMATLATDILICDHEKDLCVVDDKLSNNRDSIIELALKKVEDQDRLLLESLRYNSYKYYISYTYVEDNGVVEIKKRLVKSAIENGADPNRPEIMKAIFLYYRLDFEILEFLFNNKFKTIDPSFFRKSIDPYSLDSSNKCNSVNIISS